MLPSPRSDETRRLLAARLLVSIACVATLAFDGLAFVALMVAMGYGAGPDDLLVVAMIGGILTPLLAVGGTAALLSGQARGFDVLATSVAALTLVLLQMPVCLWLGMNVRW